MIPKPIHLLLIDDNPDDRELAKRAIHRDLPDVEFSEVLHEGDFEAALNRGGFDAVVTDFRLGWSDGLTLFGRFQQQYPEVPVIMFTNTGSEETCAAGMRAGLFDYIIKRRDQFPKLPAAIRAALLQQQTKEQLRASEMRLAQLLDRERSARAEAELARVDAERANKLKDEFLATVSHELRTPLNAILGYATLLLDDLTDPEETRHGLEVIQRNAKAQAHLIEDLLDLSRIVSGKIRLDVQTLDLLGAVHTAIEVVAPSAEQKNISVETILDPNAGPVRGDASRIQQIVWNLLTNAVKFTPAGGKIQISLERIGSHIELSVSDTGIGIRPEHLPHIFDMFRQGDSSTTRRFGGLGIGLAVAKNLAELHGGSIKATSEGEAKGACFTICLPIVIMRETELDLLEAQSDAESELETLLLSGVRVLTVDDDPDSGELIARLLERRGAEVTCRDSAAEALSFLKQGPVDVLLSDIGMPGEDGYALISKVRDLAPDQNGTIPAAALTAFTRSEDRQRALLAGFDTHISKPVDPRELLAVVAALAKRSERFRKQGSEASGG